MRTTLKASYTNHYRRGMIELLDVLQFGSTIPAHPLLAALEYIRRHAKANAVIAYGKSGEISTNHKEEVEMTVACLRILQAGPGLREHPDAPARPGRTRNGSRVARPARPARGDRAVLGAHPPLYGEINLDLGRRLTIGEAPGTAAA